MILMFPKDIESIIWWLFSFHSPTLSYVTPNFRPYEPHLCILALERKMRTQEWEFTCDFQEKRGFSPSFQDFPFHRSLLSEENFSKYEKLKFSLDFQIKNILSINFKLFLSSSSMRHTISSQIVKTYFHWISWNTSQKHTRHVSSWSRMKILSYEAMSNFSVFGRICIARTWFSLFNQFVKLVSLSTFSTHNHMRSGNKVQKLSKCTIKIPESFHHLWFSSYLLVTLHLPWSLANDEFSKLDKMSSTHPN